MHGEVFATHVDSAAMRPWGTSQLSGIPIRIQLAETGGIHRMPSQSQEGNGTIKRRLAQAVRG